MALKDENIKWNLDVNGKPAMNDLNKLEQETRKYEKVNKDLRVELQKLEAAGKKNTKEYKDLKEQISRNNAVIGANKQKMGELRKQVGLNAMTMRQLRSEYKSLKNQMDNLTPGTAEWNKLNTQLTAVKGRMTELNGGVQRTNGMFGMLKSSLTSLLPALGLTTLIAGISRLIKFQDELVKTERKVKKLTNVASNEVGKLTGRFEATAKQFDADFDELIIATNSFAKTMGEDLGDALTLVQDGYLAGADASGEFIAMLKEYGPHFKEAGFEADQAIALMQQQVESGIFADKGVDVIKEGMLRLREFTQGTRDAIDGIGLSSAEMEEQIRSGQITYFEAMQMVSKKLDELDGQAPEVGTAIADIFGGPGEDAGLEYIRTLKDINLNLDDIKEKSSEYNKSEEEMLRINEQLRESMHKTMGGKSSILQRGLIEGKKLIIKILEGFSDLQIWVEKTWNAFAKLYNQSKALRLLFVILKRVIPMPFVMGYQMIWSVIESITLLGQAVGELMEGNFKAAAGKAVEAFDKATMDIMGLIDEIKNVDKIELELFSIDGDKVNGVFDSWGKGYTLFVNEQKKLAEERVKAEKKAADEIAKLYAQLLERLRQLRFEHEKSQMTQYEQELADINWKYDQEIEKAKGFTDIIKGLEELRQLELAEARKRHDEETMQQSYESMLQFLQKQYEAKRAVLDEQIAEEAIVDDEAKKMKLNAELAYYKSINEIQILYGQETIANDKKIRDTQLKIIEDQAQKEKKILDEKVKTVEDVQGSISSVIDSALNDADASFDGFINNLLAAGLDFLEKQVQLEIAAITAKQIATKGVGGIATSIFLGAIVKAAFATAKAAISQRASGKYDVIGAEDGKMYKGVPYAGDAKTGIYGRPTIINERGDELIVSGAHTKYLTQFNPEVIRTILSTKNKVPQRQAGNIPDIPQPVINNDGIVDELRLLRSDIRNIKAIVDILDVEEGLNTLSDIRSDQSIS